MRFSHCCLPFCRYGCTLNAVCGSLGGGFQLEATHASRRPAIRERPCSAHRSGATLSWHRPQRLHMKTRASLALIRLGPGGADAAAATSPHRLCLLVLAALPEVRFVIIVLVLYDVPVLLVTSFLSNCLSVRPSVCPSVCPLLVVSKRRVLVFTICRCRGRCSSQMRCHHNKTAPTSTSTSTTSNQMRNGIG